MIMTLPSSGFLSILVIISALFSLITETQAGSKDFWEKDDKYFNYPNCSGDQYPNLPLLNGVYCFNNGTGICKAFAGQFEFYFDTFEDRFLYPAPKSQYVDEFGYHTRIPVSYNINGSVIYADRSINWAKSFRKNLEGRKISLLSTKDFNWCGYTAKDWWPYKSSIIDYKSGGRYQIYFHNRQSCIYDKNSTKPPQHFNTRFLHKSDLRIDLDYNPTIFAMEDKKAGEIRLVKHKRQHWYEVAYSVRERPTPEINYFVEMDVTEKLPCKIDGQEYGNILSKRAYAKVSNICLNDWFISRSTRSPKNNNLFNPYYGADEVELTDLPYPFYVGLEKGRHVLLEADLHNLPRLPKMNELFYGIKIDLESDWEKFAKDGFVFSAVTTIPLPKSEGSKELDTRRVRVLMLYSSFNSINPKDRYDEYYPVPYLADYTAEWTGGDSWEFDREANKKQLTNLNYVDDIAYLHECKTVLIIFGPLYSELPENKFDINTKATVDSIDKLGIWDMANAFFAEPTTRNLYVYHRTNWVSVHQYTCAKSPNDLVTAVKANGGKYFPRHGASQLPVFNGHDLWDTKDKFDFSEETLFQTIGVFKRSARSPEAPDPALYPLGSDEADQPAGDSNYLLVYIIVGVGILLIVAMCLACLMTFRRRRRKRKLDELARRKSKLDEQTRRSSMLSHSNISSQVSKRSALKPSLSKRSALQPSASRRSALQPSASKRSALRSSVSRRSALKGPTSLDSSSATSARSSLHSSRAGSPSRNISKSRRSSTIGSSHPKTTLNHSTHVVGKSSV